ncbi:MAG: cytoplasmic protein [Desulfovibrionaceae bacterium]
MEKTALFAFNGELMCFVHVLLNGLDMKAKGYDVAIVVEGAAVALVPQLEQPDTMFHALYVKAKELGVFAGVCKACSAKLGVLEGVQASGLALLDDMSGHPSMSGYMERGYTIITF